MKFSETSFIFSFQISYSPDEYCFGYHRESLATKAPCRILGEYGSRIRFEVEYQKDKKKESSLGVVSRHHMSN